MSATRMVPVETLATYFEAFTKRFLRDGRPRAVDVEVLEPEMGDQFPVVGARLFGIVYDAGTGVLEVLMDSGDHRIEQLQEVWIIEEKDGFPTAIQIVRSGGTRELVTVKRVGLRQTHSAVRFPPVRIGSGNDEVVPKNRDVSHGVGLVAR